MGGAPGVLRGLEFTPLGRERELSTGRFLSPVRRIEGVAPPADERCVAMVFRDGPVAAPPRPDYGQARWRGNSYGRQSGKTRPPAEVGLTEALLDVLRHYGGKATFAVIGSTAANYPDREGVLGSPAWNGTSFDHFPEYGRDALGGVETQPDLVRRMIAEGHELANHSYRHIPSGPAGPALRRRTHHAGVAAVMADVLELHNRVKEHFGYTMRLGRPPHLRDTFIYDVYAGLGYNCLGAGVDGGGWRASTGSYDNDVEGMVLPLQRTLERDGRALSGKIIVQKDGYNMSRESPVVAALPREMQLLRNYGYRLVTVSELLEASPFADLGPSHPAFSAARDLLRRGFWVATRTNEVRPNVGLVRGELAVWCLGAARPPREGEVSDEPGQVAVYRDVPVGHPYRWHVETAVRRGFWRGLPGTSGRPVDPDARGSRVFGIWDPVTLDEFHEVMTRAGIAVGRKIPKGLEPEAGSDVAPGGLTHAQALVLMQGG